MIPIEEECWTCVSERGMRFEMNGQLLSSDEKTVASPMEGNYIATGVDANGLSQETTWENTGPNLYGNREIHGNPSPHYYSFTDQGKFPWVLWFPRPGRRSPSQHLHASYRVLGILGLLQEARNIAGLACVAGLQLNCPQLATQGVLPTYSSSVQKPTKNSVVPWTSGWLRTGFPTMHDDNPQYIPILDSNYKPIQS